MAERFDFDRVAVTAQGSVAVLALNHPDVMNATSGPMMRGLLAALDFIESAGRFRAVILTGEGRAFCAGANLNETGDGDDTGEMLERIYHPVLRRLRDFPLPVVVAVNGPAVGIGMSIALSGDLIVVARSAYFLLSFLRIGLVPDGGATWLLPRLVGAARARELALLAEPLSAGQALDWGLVNRVADDSDVMADALALAQRLADGPAALPLARKLLRDSSGNSYEEQLAAERAAQSRAGQTEDFREGLAAFHQKRPAKFTGQ